jgi:hypothetical protein
MAALLRFVLNDEIKENNNTFSREGFVEIKIDG